MAVRFQCSACSQPIEVDDEWASRAVACPYCRKTITAPAESTLEDLSRIPTATPLTAPTDFSAPSAAQPPGQPVGEPNPNRIAIVALVLALATMALAGLYLQVLGAHQTEIETFYKPGMSFGEQMEAFSDYIQSEQGNIPAWVMALSLLPLSAGLSWIAAIVCAIIGVRHPQRRGLAVAALLIVGCVPLLLCCGGGLFLGGSV